MKNSEKSTSNKSIIYGEPGYDQLNGYIRENQFSKIFVLVDSNTHKSCLSLFLNRLESSIETEVIEMETGESNKTIETCSSIWKVLSELGADRKSLMINLGGGVVTDLGGFVAAAFKRGIAWINVPTTLLAMVDAAVGGKNGVNLENLKNQVGVIKPAELVLIDTTFLETLPPAEMRSGLAEMLKHGLIQDENYWKKLTSLDQFSVDDLDALIEESIEIKGNIVLQDPTENNIRKSLNYGHTFGHAIESYFMEHPTKKKLLHGEAVAIGMIMATFLSSKICGFPLDKLEEISNALLSIYEKVSFDKEDQEGIISLLKFDKKNEGGKINFVLLEDIGKPVIDCEVSGDLMHHSFKYYSDLQ